MYCELPNVGKSFPNLTLVQTIIIVELFHLAHLYHYGCNHDGSMALNEGILVRHFFFICCGEEWFWEINDFWCSHRADPNRQKTIKKSVSPDCDDVSLFGTPYIRKILPLVKNEFLKIDHDYCWLHSQKSRKSSF